jgi:NRPS condensation-like uncharacterized protein
MRERFMTDMLKKIRGINKTYLSFMDSCAPFKETNTPLTEGNPDILPANAHDRANYIAKYGLGNYQIQTVLRLDGRLDFEKLTRAVRLSIDQEPVFGCHFVKGNPPYWKKIDNLDEVEFCVLEETDNPDEAVQRFLESHLSMDKDPKVKIKIIRSGEYDTLCIKLNHACCDGGGAKEYTHLLAHIYSCIDRENGSFIPQPRIGGRKDQDRLLNELWVKNLKITRNPIFESPNTMWAFPWRPG